MKENGKIIRCPKCGSKEVSAVMPFDYIKQCDNPKCRYRLTSTKGWKYQFMTEEHN